MQSQEHEPKSQSNGGAMSTEEIQALDKGTTELVSMLGKASPDLQEPFLEMVRQRAHQTVELIASDGVRMAKIDDITKPARKNGTGGSFFGYRVLPASVSSVIEKIVSQGRPTGKPCSACGHQEVTGGVVIDLEKSKEAAKLAQSVLAELPIPCLVIVGPSMSANPFAKPRKSSGTSNGQATTSRGDITEAVGTRKEHRFKDASKVYAEVVEKDGERQIKVEKDGSLHKSWSHAAGVFTHANGNVFWSPVKETAPVAA